MLLPRALLVPHWPTLLEDEHRRHRTPMLEALVREGRLFLAERPEAVVILSARGESSGPFQVGAARFHRTITDDPAFGVEARYDCAGHPELGRRLVDAGAETGLRVGAADRGVDGSVIVPLHFLAPSKGLRVVPLSISDRSAEECRTWGAVIRRVLEARPERIGFVVSGMLSHATHAWKFGRHVPDAAELDEAVLAALKGGAWDEIRPAAEKWRQRAHPEAGLRHLEVLRGFLGTDLPGEVLAYEAGPGMGAALVAFGIPGAVSVAPPEPAVEEEPAAPPRRRIEAKPPGRRIVSGPRRRRIESTAPRGRRVETAARGRNEWSAPGGRRQGTAARGRSEGTAPPRGRRDGTAPRRRIESNGRRRERFEPKAAAERASARRRGSEEGVSARTRRGDERPRPRSNRPFRSGPPEQRGVSGKPLRRDERPRQRSNRPLGRGPTAGSRTPRGGPRPRASRPARKRPG